MRAQTSLPALAIAFLLVTAGTVVTVSTASSTLERSTRESLDRQAAVALSERLVGADSALTTRSNVVNATRIGNLTIADLQEQYGLAEDVAVEIRLGGETLVRRATPQDGVRVERLVVLQRRQERTIEPTLDWNRKVALPRRTSRVRLTIRSPPNTTVRAVRVDGRIRLRDPSGLNGTLEIPLSTARTPTLRFDATGSLPEGSVRIRFYPAQTEKARLVVTVDG